jgi:histone H3/H4
MARSEQSISAGTMPTFVDPRTGFHYEVKDGTTAVPCPVLDDLSRETREERQRKAAAALPAAVAKQMKEEGYRLRFKESYKKKDFEFGDSDGEIGGAGLEAEDGWAEETLQHAHRRRLEDIRFAQTDTRFAFEIISFSNFVREVIQDFGTSFLITAEAMEVLQTCAEAHVVEVIRDACSVAIKRSPVLTADDIDLVRQLREQLQGAV